MNTTLLLNRIQAKQELIQGSSNDKSSVHKSHLGDFDHIECHDTVFAHSSHCMLYLKSFQHAYNDHLKYQVHDQSTMTVVNFLNITITAMLLLMIHDGYHAGVMFTTRSTATWCVLCCSIYFMSVVVCSSHDGKGIWMTKCHFDPLYAEWLAKKGLESKCMWLWDEKEDLFKWQQHPLCNAISIYMCACVDWMCMCKKEEGYIIQRMMSNDISNISGSSTLLLMRRDVKIVKDDIRDWFSLELFPITWIVVVVGYIDGVIAS